MDDNEKKCLTILEIMLADMRTADSLYAPTDFWGVGVKRIVNEIREKGLSSFRSHRSANSLFVPLYSWLLYRNHQELIDPLLAWLDTLPYRKAGSHLANVLTGRANALADYRVFRAADSTDPPMLSESSESNAGQPIEHFNFNSCNYSLSFLNYLKGLVFLKKHLRPGTIKRTLEIGGGFGTLGEIMLKADDKSLYVDVDLPPVAAVATYYLREVFGEAAVLGYDQTREWKHIDIDKIPASCRAVILCPWQLPKLHGKIDLFANFISFQEMEPDIVQNYIKLVQDHEPEYVLLRNLKEGKRKKTSPDTLGVKEPVLLNEMISWFNQYKNVVSDTVSFGELKIDNFHSEITVLTKK